MIAQLYLALFISFSQHQPAEIKNAENSIEMVHQDKIVDMPYRSQFILLTPGPPLIDQDKLERYMDHLDKCVTVPPINAQINANSGIKPGRSGYRLYRKKFIKRFYAAFYSKQKKAIQIPLIAIQPKVNSELLSEIRVRPIGQYTTHFNAANTSRSHNISLAAQALNNYVVFPGEIFSFNQVVGPRTKEKGYERAKIIVRGEYSEGIGGGICQVSSTLFNAVDRAGLRITQRFSHSKHVSYVPPGRDATVSWYGPDFQFQNNYNQPVLLRTRSYGSSISFNLYSSEVINISPKQIPSPSKILPKESRPSNPPSENKRKP